MLQEVKIIVAAHKPYRMPEDKMYLPLQVGAAGKNSIGFERDDTGDNISVKNPYYCELTGLFWAWKNLDADYIGLVHYRRHFGHKKSDPLSGVLTYKDLEPYLGSVKVFVPKKRRYFIETIYSHYEHTHFGSQLDMMREILEEKYPEYCGSYDRVVKYTYGYMFNMAVMKKAILDAYCTWLFDILFALESRIDMPDLSAFQKRFFGRISEIAFNVWLDREIESGELKRHEVKELPYFHVENINWLMKGTAFLRAKFFGKKYEESF